jgi:hypothetical protein
LRQALRGFQLILQIDVKEEYQDLVEKLGNESDLTPAQIVTQIVNNHLRTITWIKADIEKFYNFINEKPYSGRWLPIYRWRLRRSLNWTNAYLMDIEDEVFASKEGSE